MPLFSQSRRRGRRASRGQSLVEFALALPVLLLIVLVTLDFGRALYGWIIVQNSARIAANFAGANADGWRGSGDPDVVAEYEVQIERDLNTANCQAASTPPSPVFTDGPDTAVGGGYPDTDYDVGDTVVVDLTCTFRPITPIIGDIVGKNVTLGARSEFRIRSGELVGLANPTTIPTPGPTPAPTPAGTPTPTPPPGPTPTPAPSPSPSPSPTPTCNVSVTIGRSPNGTVNAGASVQFTATVTATGCSVSTAVWTFPSGSPGSGSGLGPHSVSFSNSSGSQQIYTVSVLVTMNTGTTATDTEDVRVRSS